VEIEVRASRPLASESVLPYTHDPFNTAATWPKSAGASGPMLGLFSSGLDQLLGFAAGGADRGREQGKSGPSLLRA